MPLPMNTPFPAPAPAASPETTAFWEATANGVMLLPRCDACDSITWYPRGFCAECGSLKLTWIPASGRGTVYAFTVHRLGQEPAAYRGASPYVVAYVELAEGPRVLTNIVECDPNAVRVGQQVELVFHATGSGPALYRFRPATAAGDASLP